VDRRRFPRGLRYITDHAHARNVKSIVWFEPERVNPGTWLYLQRPQWLLGKTGSDQLLNLGNPEARQWLTEHVDHLINAEGIDLYRNDFNIDPLPFWRANDAPDRQGISEIRYVTGFLAYWDELLRRHPGMLIDTCASGGRRNDLETLRRSVPLLRSDYILEPVGQQLHTYGLAMWVPFFGTGINSTDPYVFRSQMCPHLTGCWDVRNRQLDYPRLRELYGQWRKVADYFFGDFYPLTPYAIDNQCWMAWQFDLPEKGEGMIQAFRRGESPFESARFKLRGLQSTSRYRFSRVDDTGNQVYSGEDLMQQGVVIPITAQPGAEIYIYKELRN
jgi:alpha-galactosidase